MNGLWNIFGHNRKKWSKLMLSCYFIFAFHCFIQQITCQINAMSSINKAFIKLRNLCYKTKMEAQPCFQFRISHQDILNCLFHNFYKVYDCWPLIEMIARPFFYQVHHKVQQWSSVKLKIKMIYSVWSCCFITKLLPSKILLVWQAAS